MNDYNFWADAVDAYRNSSDWIKALWLVVPPTFILGLGALGLLWHGLRGREERRTTGDLAYTMVHEPDGRLRIYRHVPPPPGLPGAGADPGEPIDAGQVFRFRSAPGVAPYPRGGRNR